MSKEADIHIGRRQTNLNELDENDATDYFDLIDLDEAPHLFKTPTLICFSGRGAYTPDVAAQFARAARRAFHLRHKPLCDLQVLAAWYPGTSQDLSADALAFHSPFLQADEDSPYFYVERFVHRFLRPLYMKGNKRLPVQVAQKNLRNLNIFGYSYGASIVQLMGDVLNEDMQKAGYSDKQINLLQSQIFVLTAGANINPNNYKNGFTTYHIMNTQDEIVFFRMRPLLETKELPEGQFICTQLYKQPNQKVLLFCDAGNDFPHSPHHITSYFPDAFANKGHRQMLGLKQGILINALNNSVMNAHRGDFVALSEVEKEPDKCLFLEKESDQATLVHLSAIERNQTPTVVVRHLNGGRILPNVQKENE